ncbi:MAG TPA: hypothetical protein VE175_05890 [Woeseiaceae bacterium]|nr:hypothetical protein [Woeseiaceae bacterium]
MENEILRWHPYVSAFDDAFLNERGWLEFASAWDVGHLDEGRQMAFGRLFCLAEDIGRNNLYGAFDSFVTAEPLMEMIRLLRKHDIPLPGIEPILRSGVEENGGWGATHPRDFFVARGVFPKD